MLAELVDIVHFAEAGPVEPDARVDIAFVEGSITTAGELQRIQRVRANSRYLITIGACATAGGIQALRNNANVRDWMAAIYAQSEFIDTLETSTAIAEHVRVDFELWGCPISSQQIVAVIRALLFGVVPLQEQDSLCFECKRQGNVCVLVTGQQACMGPVTKAGCGALCPKFGRACYACYGPKENANPDSLSQRFQGFGLLPDEIAHKFLSINNSAPVFAEAGKKAKENGHD